MYTHFPKDRNCEVCLRTKMTRAPCRRREAVPWAKGYGDLITPDHKVLNEGCESTRSCHSVDSSCEDLSWNHRTSTPHRSETGLDERCWSNSMECSCSLRNVQDLLADGKTPHERRHGEPFKRPIIPFGSMVESHPISAREQRIIHQFGKKVSPGISLDYELIVRGKLERIYFDSRLGRFGKVGRIRNLTRSRWYSKIVRERLRIPRTHSKAGEE